MNIDDIKTTLVHGSTSCGKYGTFKLEIRVNTDPGYELTKAERFALYDAEKLVTYAFMKARVARDPQAADAAAVEKRELLSLFPSAVLVEELPNGYCSDWCCTHLPWFRITTTKGRVEIGWRKRVINIEWEERVAGTAASLFPNEEVTKGERSIHAWSVEDAARYMKEILK